MLDFNGTLAQDDHVVAPLYVDIFASVGVPLTVEDYHRELAAMPDREASELAIRRAGLPLDEAHRDALVQARLDGYLAAVAQTIRRSPSTRSSFSRRAAADRALLAITSGAFRREIEHVLRAAGVRDLFQASSSRSTTSRVGKPVRKGSYARSGWSSTRSPAAIRRSSPWEAVAVEDATGGAQAAHAAGMRVAAIRRLGV